MNKVFAMRSGAELTMLLVVYALLKRFYEKHARLHDGEYDAPMVLLRILGRPAALLCVAGPAIPLAWFYKAASWSSLGDRWWMKAMVGTIAAGMCAFGAFYARNWYVDRSHVCDRLTLVAVSVATAFHPVFVAPLIGLFFIAMGQFIQPLCPEDYNHWNAYSHKMVFAHQMTAFLAYCLVRLICGDVDSRCWLTAALIIQGANYFWSALDKLRLQWLTRSDPVGLVAAAVAHGWRKADGHSARIGRILTRYKYVMLSLCVVTEISGALFTLHVSVLWLAVAAITFFHSCVFYISGINFFPWVVVNVMLAASVSLRRDAVLGGNVFVMSIVLMTLFVPLLRPFRLAWLDVRLCNAYRFVATAPDGTDVELTADVFAPFDMVAAIGKFRYLSNEKLLVDAWAECYEPALAARLKHLRTFEEVRRLEEMYGHNYYSSGLGERVNVFLLRFMDAVNRGTLSGVRCFVARDWLSRGGSWNALMRAPIDRIDIKIVRALYTESGEVAVDEHLVRSLSPRS